MSGGNFDYVIVGAGAAGCVLANRLSADPACRVALLEAGGPDKAREIAVPAAFSKLFMGPYDWNFRTSKQEHLADRELYWPRGKTLGGSTSINAQMWVRGHPADYDGWGETCPGWSYADVLPYFHRAEHRDGRPPGRVYGANGPLWISELRGLNPATVAFLAACAELGMRRLGELNEDDTIGYTAVPVTQKRGRRWSAADAYLRPAMGRPNLTVLTGALVERVEMDEGRATGVSYRDAAGTAHRVEAAREVILTAGAVNTPQILQLSGIGDPDQLRAVGIEPKHELPEVGANLQDHLSTGVIVNCPQPVTMVTAESLGQLARYLFLRKGMLASNVAEAVAFIRTDPDLPAPDIELIFAPVPFLDHGQTAPSGHGLTIGVVLLQPASRGRITLASANPADPPVIDPGYLSSDADARTLIAGLRAAERFLQTKALAPFVGAPMDPWPGPSDDARLDEFLRERAETLYHPVGTCRMGSDPDSVVDCELKVRGVPGLRVVDASVMPRINRGHTQAPVYMIAERAADFLSTSH
ncbi:MAG TPA: GMC family oxidoreductase N-terminal domain-containing protein [Micromonosporaceae bacterium]|nr:GMC family oxidoreductase N-terminal domain-containing protein [Micromonosporaceae bacterium]